MYHACLGIRFNSDIIIMHASISKEFFFKINYLLSILLLKIFKLFYVIKFFWLTSDKKLLLKSSVYNKYKTVKQKSYTVDVEFL